MKKLFATMLVVSLLAVSAYPAAAESVAEVEEAVENPLAGMAVDENGEPYVLGYVMNEVSGGFMSGSYNYTKMVWEAAGGKFLSYISDYDYQYESDSVKELVDLGADAILVHPGDSYAIAPAVQDAMDAGVPVFALDMGVIGADVTSYVRADLYELGKADAEIVMEHFSEENPAHVLVVAGAMNQNGAVERDNGFKDTVADCPYVDIVYTIDTGWSNDTAYNGIQDLFTSNPEINCVFCHAYFLINGTLEGLRAANKLFPNTDEENHIFLVTTDGDQIANKAIQDGYVDADADLCCMEQTAIAVNAILTKLYGGEVEKDYIIPATVVDINNCLEPDKWGAAPAGEYDKWPIFIEQDICPVPSR